MVRKYTTTKIKEGDMFGYWRVLEYLGRRFSKNGYWNCLCTKCNSTVKPVRVDILRNGQSTKCHSCSGKINLKGYKDIRGWYYGKLQKGALKREIEFNVSLEELQGLWEKQERKCYYTRQHIWMSKNGMDGGTASLDRTDPERGYTIDNVKWVHKDINMMKWKFTHEEFIMWVDFVSKAKPYWGG